ncbi:glycosyltransferase [Calothrix rhizosoleniae]|uniref:glycosyltransferase n=1 Tax=Calothrix rhizosoleniae TaxID=888997 RepID=UPI001F1BBAE6|nr:glycosyltransferase [Calothrix rhizosoleniae]
MKVAEKTNMNILFLTTIILSKHCNGGEVASQCFIDSLRQSGHNISVVGYLRKGDILEYKKQKTLIVDERYTETSKSKYYSLIWLALSFFKSLPYSSAKYYSLAYINLVKKLLTTEKYDIIIIDHAQLAWIENFIPDKSKLIFIAHNIEHQIYKEHFKKTGNFVLNLIYRREATLIRVLEEHLLKVAQQIWTLTEHDSKYFDRLGKLGKTKTFAIPPNLTQSQDKTITKCFDIGLLGSWSWKANIEALQWFLEVVYPYLPTYLSIHIAGKGADWLDSKYSNVTYRGVVPDAQEFMAQAKVVAIPTLSGSGIQIKTLDAIASGSLIVATPIAMRGISDPPPTITVTENPEKFAQHLVSATKLSLTHQYCDDAKHWYCTRRNQFHNDINDAITKMSFLENSLV